MGQGRNKRPSKSLTTIVSVSQRRERRGEERRGTRWTRGTRLYQRGDDKAQRVREYESNVQQPFATSKLADWYNRSRQMMSNGTEIPSRSLIITLATALSRNYSPIVLILFAVFLIVSSTDFDSLVQRGIPMLERGSGWIKSGLSAVLRSRIVRESSNQTQRSFFDLRQTRTDESISHTIIRSADICNSYEVI